VLHRARGDLDVAVDLCRQALAIFLKLRERLFTAYASQSLAKIAIRQGRFPEAMRRSGSCLETCWTMDDRFGTALALRTIGELYLAQGELIEARDYLVQAHGLWATLGLPLWKARVLRDLGTVQLRLGAHKEAHWTWAQALAVFIAVDSRDAAELTAWRQRWGCSCELPIAEVAVRVPKLFRSARFPPGSPACPRRLDHT
jgi:tetratricopeptide (TPR) repeat protein